MELASDRVNLRDVLADAGLATFALPGTEQDAFAEFLIATHAAVPYRLRETSASLDDRIVDLAAHQPHLLTPFLTSTGAVLTIPTIPGWNYEVQSIDQIGGTWQTRVEFTGAGGRETITDDLPEVTNRFYRLIATP